jgi:hypothetical protein
MAPRDANALYELRRLAGFQGSAHDARHAAGADRKGKELELEPAREAVMTSCAEPLKAAVKRIIEELPDSQIGRTVGYCENIVENELREADTRELARRRQADRMAAKKRRPATAAGNVV